MVALTWSHVWATLAGMYTFRRSHFGESSLLMSCAGRSGPGHAIWHLSMLWIAADSCMRVQDGLRGAPAGHCSLCAQFQRRGPQSPTQAGPWLPHQASRLHAGHSLPGGLAPAHAPGQRWQHSATHAGAASAAAAAAPSCDTAGGSGPWSRMYACAVMQLSGAGIDWLLVLRALQALC